MVKEGVVKGFSIEGYFTDKMQQMSSKNKEEEVILEQMRGIIRGECAK